MKIRANMSNFGYFLGGRVTFRLLGDLMETNFVQKVSKGDFGLLKETQFRTLIIASNHANMDRHRPGPNKEK